MVRLKLNLPRIGRGVFLNNKQAPFDDKLWNEASSNIGKPRIAILGFTGAGKSMLVNALFGEAIASVNARAGWTRIPQFIEHRLFELIDTPGFGADGWVVDEFDRKIIEPSDIVVHVINGASGVTDYDMDMQKVINRHPGLVIVLNKIDILDSVELNESLEGIASAMSIPKTKVISVSAKNGSGIEGLAAEMTRLLPDVKKTSFVSSLSGEGFTETRKLLAVKVVDSYAICAAAIGVVPIPLADIAALAPLQVAMFLHVAKTFGHFYTKKQALAIIASLMGSIGARSIAQATVSIFKSIPGIGTVLGAVAGGGMAHATFKAFGALVIYYFSNNQEVSPADIRGYYNRQYEEARKKYKKKR
jgi:small GTP-binding protein